jgi:phosphatidylglycerophosphate synthase
MTNRNRIRSVGALQARLTIPDALTLARLLSVPVLWIVALLRGPFWLGIGLSAASFTDVLDGQIARRSTAVLASTAGFGVNVTTVFIRSCLFGV